MPLPNTGLNLKTLSHGSDGTDGLPLAVDASGRLISGGGVAPTGSATSANQATQITAEQAIQTAVETGGDLNLVNTSILGAQGQLKHIRVSNTFANYAGVEITITGLVANAPYRLAALTFLLAGGTPGNTTTPSVGEATGFAVGDISDRAQASVAIVDGNPVNVDNYVQPIPVVADANGQLYILGAAPGAADSTLSWAVDLYEDRSA